MKRILYIFYFFLLLGSFSARSQVTVPAEILPQKETVSAGEEFFLALKLKLPRGWHVYWKNAGDAGEAIDLKLTLPEGFAETGRFWPTPRRFKVSSLTEYGYDRDAWLLVGVRAPDKFGEKEVLEISGRAVWLACHDECVPMAQDVATLIVFDRETKSAENEELAAVVAELPEKTDRAVFFETPDSLILSHSLPDQAVSAYFFPENSKTIIHSAPQRMKVADNKAFLFMQKVPAEDFVPSEKLKGTLVFYNVQGETLKAWDIEASKTADGLPVFEEPLVLYDFLSALFFAFVGGVLLNLMPCVFPVLSLKAFRLLNVDKSSDPAARRKAGLCYTAGVVLSFVLISLVLIGLRKAGAELGWGFQLQYPPFVYGLCLFMFFLGLVFSDVVSVGEKISAFGLNLGRNWGDFGTGVLAVVVATPCAAPFMGTALGYGLMNPAPVTICVFVVMGLGLAFPFLLLDFYPSLGRFLPKAGAWTALLRQFLAFPLYGAAAWLLWVLAAQEGNAALGVGLIGIVTISFCCWVFQAAVNTDSLKKISLIVLLVTIITVGYGFAVLSPSYLEAQKQTGIEWQPYDTDKIQEYRQAGVPVFIKFSAKWCLTCLVNEKTAFSSAELAETFRRKGVAAFAADWTNRSDEITAALESFGRGGIPLYVYYAPHAKQPQILPQLITDQTILSFLKDL
ncbi:MAG: thioredoxin family protein [Alphaproteobacteria bacterium]|nr:thioredoxin family protein [Alphaproteobacteria bacterium]